jgi:16S rRNA (uracil1498-N3)-methyltransferase
MQRYFCNKLDNNKFTLSDDDSFHIEKVMRMKIGDLVEIVYDHETYISVIESFHPVTCSINKKTDENNEMNKKIIICQSLVNEQKMDFILQKCTELGMYSFIPYKAVNSIIKVNDKMDKKIDRWQRIVKEASEQSKRNIIPEVKNVMNINELINYKADLKLICSTINDNKLKNVIREHHNYDTIMLVIGPEGGFDPHEEELFINNGFIPVSLGKRILRTETASLCALSQLNYEWW